MIDGRRMGPIRISLIKYAYHHSGKTLMFRLMENKGHILRIKKRGPDSVSHFILTSFCAEY